MHGQTGAERVGSLDGLRAAAIVLVLVHHFAVGGDPNLGIRSIPEKIAVAGWIGVDLFFVLSGFLVTGILRRSASMPGRFRNFFARRALRILPLYYVALLLVFVVLPLAGCLPTRLREQLYYWFYVANFRPSDIGPGCAQLGHFWSLAIEEQYYLVWPVVVFWASRRTGRRICLFLIGASLLFRGVLAGTGAGWRSYYWTFARMDAIAAGSYVAYVWDSARARMILQRWSPAVALVTGVITAAMAWRGWLDLTFFENPSPSVLFGRVALPLVVTLLFSAMLVLSLQTTWFAALLDNGLFRFISRYSYGLYVWHLLLLNAIFARTGNLAEWPRAGVAIGVSFVVAIASFHLLEQPLLSLKRFFPQASLTDRSAR